MHKYINTYIHKPIHIHIHTHTHMHTHIRIHHIHVHIYIYIHHIMCIYIYIYVYTQQLHISVNNLKCQPEDYVQIYVQIRKIIINICKYICADTNR